MRIILIISLLLSAPNTLAGPDYEAQLNHQLPRLSGALTELAKKHSSIVLLGVHDQTLGLQTAEIIPVGPRGYEVGVGQQDPWSIAMTANDTHRFAGLYQQGLVVLELLQGTENRIQCFVVPRRFASASVDNEVVRIFSHVGIQVIKYM